MIRIFRIGRNFRQQLVLSSQSIEKTVGPRAASDEMIMNKTEQSVTEWINHVVQTVRAVRDSEREEN